MKKKQIKNSKKLKGKTKEAHERMTILFKENVKLVPYFLYHISIVSYLPFLKEVTSKPFQEIFFINIFIFNS